MGFDPGSPGSRPGPKAGAKLLRHPGIPSPVLNISSPHPVGSDSLLESVLPAYGHRSAGALPFEVVCVPLTSEHKRQTCQGVLAGRCDSWRISAKNPEEEIAYWSPPRPTVHINWMNVLFFHIIIFNVQRL